MSDQGAADKKVVRVVIFQQAYTLRSAGTPGETETLAAGVDQLMNQIAARSGAGDPARVAVLAALHLADRARQLETEIERFNERAQTLDQRLSEILSNK